MTDIAPQTPSLQELPAWNDPALLMPAPPAPPADPGAVVQQLSEADTVGNAVAAATLRTPVGRSIGSALQHVPGFGWARPANRQWLVIPKVSPDAQVGVEIDDPPAPRPHKVPLADGRSVRVDPARGSTHDTLQRLLDAERQLKARRDHALGGCAAFNNPFEPYGASATPLGVDPDDPWPPDIRAIADIDTLHAPLGSLDLGNRNAGDALWSIPEGSRVFLGSDGNYYYDPTPPGAQPVEPRPAFVDPVTGEVTVDGEIVDTLQPPAWLSDVLGGDPAPAPPTAPWHEWRIPDGSRVFLGPGGNYYYDPTPPGAQPVEPRRAFVDPATGEVTVDGEIVDTLQPAHPITDGFVDQPAPTHATAPPIANAPLGEDPAPAPAAPPSPPEWAPPSGSHVFLGKDGKWYYDPTPAGAMPQEPKPAFVDPVTGEVTVGGQVVETLQPAHPITDGFVAQPTQPQSAPTTPAPPPKTVNLTLGDDPRPSIVDDLKQPDAPPTPAAKVDEIPHTVERAGTGDPNAVQTTDLGTPKTASEIAKENLDDLQGARERVVGHDPSVPVSLSTQGENVNVDDSATQAPAAAPTESKDLTDLKQQYAQAAKRYAELLAEDNKSWLNPVNNVADAVSNLVDPLLTPFRKLADWWVTADAYYKDKQVADKYAPGAETQGTVGGINLSSVDEKSILEQHMQSLRTKINIYETQGAQAVNDYQAYEDQMASLGLVKTTFDQGTGVGAGELQAKVGGILQDTGAGGGGSKTVVGEEAIERTQARGRGEAPPGFGEDTVAPSRATVEPTAPRVTEPEPLPQRGEPSEQATASQQPEEHPQPTSTQPEQQERPTATQPEQQEQPTATQPEQQEQPRSDSERYMPQEEKPQPSPPDQPKREPTQRYGTDERPAPRAPEERTTQQQPAGENEQQGGPLLPVEEHHVAPHEPDVRPLTPEEIERWQKEVDADYRAAQQGLPRRPGPALPDAPGRGGTQRYGPGEAAAPQDGPHPPARPAAPQETPLLPVDEHHPASPGPDVRPLTPDERANLEHDVNVDSRDWLQRDADLRAQGRDPWGRHDPEAAAEAARTRDETPTRDYSPEQRADAEGAASKAQAQHDVEQANRAISEGKAQQDLQKANEAISQGKAQQDVERAQGEIRHGEAVKQGQEAQAAAAKIEQAAADAATTGRGKLMLLHPNDAAVAGAESIRPEPGYYDVVVHGNKKGVAIATAVDEQGHGTTWKFYTPEELATAVRNAPDYEGGPVRLVSCDTGKVFDVKGVSPGYAHEFSRALNEPVLAPTNKAFPTRRGGVLLGSDATSAGQIPHALGPVQETPQGRLPRWSIPAALKGKGGSWRLFDPKNPYGR